AAVEPDADELAAVRQRLLQRREGLVLAQVAQEAQDQGAGEAQRLLRPLARAAEAADHRLERHAARRVRLRVEEQLGMHDVVGLGHRPQQAGKPVAGDAVEIHWCYFPAPGTLPSTPLTKKLIASSHLSSATSPFFSTSLPSLVTIGPFQIAKLPSFRPDLAFS